jgi:oligopeptide transport system substrate-binding protein
MQTQWHQSLEVEIDFQVLPWAEFVDRVRKAPPHLSLLGWEPDYPDPDSYLRVAVQRHTAWRDARYFDLVERAQHSLDLTERMALYAQAEQILVEEVPLLPLSYPRVHLFVKPWVRSSPRAAAGAFFWKDVVIVPH